MAEKIVSATKISYEIMKIYMNFLHQQQILPALEKGEESEHVRTVVKI